MHNASTSPWSEGLPAELLAYIFKLLAADLFYNSPVFTYDPPKDLGFISVSHVCRNWREVALGDSALWGYDVFCPLGSIVSAKLERSEGTGLFLRCQSGYIDDVEDTIPPRASQPTAKYLEMVMQHMHRIRSLRIDDPCLEEEFLPMLRTSSPPLETLEIGPYLGYDPQRWCFYLPARGEDNYSLNKTFRRDHASLSFPGLRCLRLSHRSLCWTSPLFASTLVRLEVECDRQFHRVRRSKYVGQEMLRALDTMSCLQILTLVYAIPRARGTDSASASRRFKAVLPRLKSFIMFDRPSYCMWILDHVTIPTATHLLVNCETFPQTICGGDIEDCCIIPPFIARQASSGTRGLSAPLRSVEITVTYQDSNASVPPAERYIEIKGWSYDFSGIETEMGETKEEPSIALSFCNLVDDSLHSFRRVFTSIYDALWPHLADVTVLSLYHQKPDLLSNHEGPLVRILDYTPNLRSLYVEGERAIYPVLRVLAKNDTIALRHSERTILEHITTPIWSQSCTPTGTLSVSSGQHKPHLILPHLNRMILRSFSLNEVVKPEKWRLDDMLVRTLAARRALQTQNPGDSFHLHIMYAYGSQLAMKRLVEVVPQVESEAGLGFADEDEESLDSDGEEDVDDGTIYEI